MPRTTIGADLAGVPGNSFIVFGATPLHNSAVVGFQASTTIAAATQIYLRHDGEIVSGTDNHALNVGVRITCSIPRAARIGRCWRP